MSKSSARKLTRISFDVSDADEEIIHEIVKRAMRLYEHGGIETDALSVRMDVIATHANGNPLRLAALLDADDFNFLHDIVGIYRHLDRNTGKLTGFFSPRFTQRVAA